MIYYCKWCRLHFQHKKDYLLHRKTQSHKDNLEKFWTHNKKPYGTWYCCHCDKIFETRKDLYEHVQKFHKIEKSIIDKRYFNGCWNCQYCKQTFKSRRLLNQHYKTCEEKLKLPHDCKGRYKNPIAISNRLESLKNNIRIGKKFKHKKLSEEQKQHISEGTKRYLEKMKKKGGARYSFKACRYIDKLNEEKGWHLQHAENGGEISVGPYYLDGYDQELNIAFEYDETRHHYNIFDNLSEKDYEKMNYIKEKLGCRFFRYNETKNELKEF